MFSLAPTTYLNTKASVPDPDTKTAEPPLLRPKVGGVPLTVTASLMLRVRSTAAPVVTSPSPSVILTPDMVTDVTSGAVVSICSTPSGLTTAPLPSSELRAESFTVAPFRVRPVTVRSAVS